MSTAFGMPADEMEARMAAGLPLPRHVVRQLARMVERERKQFRQVWDSAECRQARARALDELADAHPGHRTVYRDMADELRPTVPHSKAVRPVTSTPSPVQSHRRHGRRSRSARPRTGVTRSGDDPPPPHHPVNAQNARRTNRPTSVLTNLRPYQRAEGTHRVPTRYLDRARPR